ncbi:MAG TPA: GNAT family protein [Ruminiclostridium sp.]
MVHRVERVKVSNRQHRRRKFKEIQVNRVESRHDLNNAASGKVMEKCGLIKEGVKRQGDKNNTGICDSVFYGLVK